MLQNLFCAVLLAGEATTVTLPIDSVEVYYAMRDYASVVRLVESKGDAPMHDKLLLGWSHYRLGDMRHAKQAFQEGLEIAPASLELLNGLAFAHYRLGEAAEAEAAFRAVLERSPERIESRRGLAFLLFTSNRFDECLPAFDAFLRHDPEDQEAEYYLVKSVDGLLSRWQREQHTPAQMVAAAWQHEAEGNRRTAFEMFHWIVQVDPFHPGARLGLGILGPEFGHEPEASQALESLLRENPRDADARAALCRLHLRAGRLQEAEREWRRLVDGHPADPRGERIRQEINLARSKEARP